MSKKVQVIIVGGTGYGAAELLRLLTGHPQAEVVSVISKSQAGNPLGDFHRNLSGFYDLTFAESINLDLLKTETPTVVFFALPHGVSASKIAELDTQLVKENLTDKCYIIDLSGDFRLEDIELHSLHYPNSKATPELRSKFIYGLTDLLREEIKYERYLANPGCYSTASVLAAAPLLAFQPSTMVFDGKSGTSGGGRNPQAVFHHPERNSNLQAYKVMEHRHEAEIHSGLGDMQAENLSIQFVPHLIPMARGIQVTLYTSLTAEVSEEELIKEYEEYYENSQFVRILSQPPEIRNVVGSNYCDIYVKKREQQVVVISAIDNLMKGMAGQAIQNMNVMLGFAEDAGLRIPGLGIV